MQATLLVGGPGTAKTAIINSFMGKLPSESYSSKTITFSSLSTPGIFQSSVEVRLGPAAHVTVGMIDDCEQSSSRAVAGVHLLGRNQRCQQLQEWPESLCTCWMKLRPGAQICCCKATYCAESCLSVLLSTSRAAPLFHG